MAIDTHTTTRAGLIAAATAWACISLVLLLAHPDRVLAATPSPLVLPSATAALVLLLLLLLLAIHLRSLLLPHPPLHRDSSRPPPPPSLSVRRSLRWQQVPLPELVAGDEILLTRGDVIPADMLVTAASRPLRLAHFTLPLRFVHALLPHTLPDLQHASSSPQPDAPALPRGLLVVSGKVRGLVLHAPPTPVLSNTGEWRWMPPVPLRPKGPLLPSPGRSLPRPDPACGSLRWGLVIACLAGALGLFLLFEALSRSRSHQLATPSAMSFWLLATLSWSALLLAFFVPAPVPRAIAEERKLRALLSSTFGLHAARPGLLTLAASAQVLVVDDQFVLASRDTSSVASLRSLVLGFGLSVIYVSAFPPALARALSAFFFSGGLLSGFEPEGETSFLTPVSPAELSSFAAGIRRSSSDRLHPRNLHGLAIHSVPGSDVAGIIRTLRVIMVRGTTVLGTISTLSSLPAAGVFHATIALSPPCQLPAALSAVVNASRSNLALSPSGDGWDAADALSAASDTPIPLDSSLSEYESWDTPLWSFDSSSSLAYAPVQGASVPSLQCLAAQACVVYAAHRRRTSPDELASSARAFLEQFAPRTAPAVSHAADLVLARPAGTRRLSHVDKLRILIVAASVHAAHHGTVRAMTLGFSLAIGGNLVLGLLLGMPRLIFLSGMALLLGTLVLPLPLWLADELDSSLLAAMLPRSVDARAPIRLALYVTLATWSMVAASWSLRTRLPLASLLGAIFSPDLDARNLIMYGESAPQRALALAGMRSSVVLALFAVGLALLLSRAHGVALYARIATISLLAVFTFSMVSLLPALGVYLGIAAPHVWELVLTLAFAVVVFGAELAQSTTSRARTNAPLLLPSAIRANDALRRAVAPPPEASAAHASE
ncbi:uncharacterized protein AMSG_10745 [Thecamonas trahens ATCC 50062]|uniref:P-type ATPase A domain-containing protein n=1 Tax=Thecamonas trahens ATCC 50062 TaxID=461836 RepID=A0A0L0DS41_THETB|nr:hypothetical protein AMSG_10745 [Thecamonas trahens ATCC 50062]KNC55139.1 hypothetical protein AMSG_10745 [Thecamonas trahens ATCC 50062]|eukprot:XP_013753197.1 hypothetical protein AMSG_10745 [Thecamonas trahens ATCC 50062]